MDWTILSSVGLGGVLALVMVRWLLRESSRDRLARQRMLEAQQDVITNHIDHSTRTNERLAAAVDKMADSVDRLAAGLTSSEDALCRKRRSAGRCPFGHEGE